MNLYQRWKQYYAYSVFCQWIEKLFGFCKGHWNQSKAVATFVALPSWEEHAGRSSGFFRFWQGLRRVFIRLYGWLKLEKLLEGSKVVNPALWVGLTVFSAAILPTMAVLAMVILGFLTMFLDYVRKEELTMVRSGVTPSCLLMAGFYMGVSVTSVNMMASLPVGLISAVFMCTPVLLVNWGRTAKQVLLLTHLLVFSATFVGLYGIYQFIFGAAAGSGWVDTNMFGSISVRVYSTLQNPNMLAQYLVLVLPFGGALLLRAKDWNERFIWLVCCGIIAIALLCTYSRGGWVGALIAGVLFLLLVQPKLLILTPVALIGLYFVLPDTVIERFTSIGNLEDSSTSYRLSIWMGSINLIKDYWFCGIGPGVAVFNMVYPYYSYATASAQHAHNLFLQMMVDGGVVMLGLFLGTIIMFCRETFRFLGKNPHSPHRLFVIASISGVVGFLAQGMTDYSFYNYRVALAFWLVLGLGAAWATAKEDDSVGKCKPCALEGDRHSFEDSL